MFPTKLVGINSPILVTGCWMLEKRNDFIDVIQYPESSIQYLILMRHELLKL